MEEEQNQETIENKGYNIKELLLFVDQYHQLPEETLLKWLMKVTLVLVLNAGEWKSIFGLI